MGEAPGDSEARDPELEGRRGPGEGGMERG